MLIHLMLAGEVVGRADYFSECRMNKQAISQMISSCESFELMICKNQTCCILKLIYKAAPALGLGFSF